MYTYIYVHIVTCIRYIYIYTSISISAAVSTSISVSVSLSMYLSTYLSSYLRIVNLIQKAAVSVHIRTSLKNIALPKLVHSSLRREPTPVCLFSEVWQDNRGPEVMSRNRGSDIILPNVMYRPRAEVWACCSA